MKRTPDLQHLLDYFKMLQAYEKDGFLEVLQEDNVAYVTLPALHAMSAGDDVREQFSKAIPETVRNIRTYAAFKSKQGMEYFSRPFAIHVVKEEFPHDLIYTLLLTRRRVWWKLWRRAEHIELIDYTGVKRIK